MKKKRLLYLLGALLGAVMIPLFFVNLFHDVGVFPGENGELQRHDYYYTIIDNLSSLNIAPIAYVSVALCAISVILCATSVFCENEKLRKTAKIFFIVSACVFFVLLLLASTIHRDY